MLRWQAPKHLATVRSRNCGVAQWPSRSPTDLAALGSAALEYGPCSASLLQDPLALPLPLPDSEREPSSLQN